MGASEFFNAIPMVNHLSTIAAIGCVFPTYFLDLHPLAYRCTLFVGIVIGLSTWIVTIMGTVMDGSSQYLWAIYFVLVFSPLNIVLIAILANIRRIARVGLWSTVVLACVVIDWAGISLLVLAVE